MVPVKTDRAFDMKWFAGMVFLGVAALPYLFMLAPSDSGVAEPEGAGPRLLIISPHRREVRQEYSRGFRAWSARHLGRPIGLRWIDVGGTSTIMKDIDSRFAANPESAGIDLFFGGGVDPFLRAARFGWLAPVDVSPGVLDGIPRRCAGTPVYDPEGYWYGVALSGFGILYNRVLLERLELPVPATWEDLADPAYFSWLGSGDPRTSGSVHMCFEIILQAYGLEAGWSLLTRLAANVRRFGEGGGAVPREVAAGEVAAGMVIDQYAQTVIDSVGPELAFVLPQGVTLVGADSIAMLRGAPSPGLAVAFIDFVLSDEGQRLLYQPRGVNGQRHALHRLPVVEQHYSTRHAPPTRPYAYESGFDYDTNIAGRRWRLVNDLVGVWFIDAHAELVAAWAALIDRGLPPGEVAALCGSPARPETLDAMAEKWGDARFRLETTRNWSQRARARYRALIQRTGKGHARL